MTNDLEQVRRFRDEVPSPGSASWARGRAALRAAIDREGVTERSGAAAPSRTGWRAFRRRHRRLAGAALIALVLVACTGIALAAGVLGPDLTSPAPRGPATSPPSSLTSSFAVLRQPRRAVDVVPAAGNAAMQTAPARHWGVNPALSRFMGTIDRSRIWLVPGSIGSCIYGAAGGSVCGPNSLVVQRGLTGALVPVNGGPPTVLGVVPDDATVTAANIDRSPAPVSRSGNTYSISGDPNLRSYTIRDRSGRTFTTSAPGPFPAHLHP